MTAQKAARIVRLREWARQIDECERSGLPVRKWCEEKGLGYKSYYYRKRRVREEVLDAMESENALMLSDCTSEQMETPVFAPLTSANVTGGSTAAVTVQIGTYVAEINNGADLKTIDGVLRTLSSL